jgi:hypothetical protein
MALRKQKSRKQQVAELAADYLKVKAVTKTAKGAGKAASKAPKKIPIMIGAGVAALAAVTIVRRRGGGEPSTA